MGSEVRAGGAPTRVPAAALAARRALTAAVSRARPLLAAALAVLLTATLVFLYYETQGGDVKHQNEVLGYLRELREIDVRWDKQALRERAGDDGARQEADADAVRKDLARVHGALRMAAATLESPVLERGLPELEAAFTEKAQFLARFSRAHHAARAALARVLGAKTEIAGLMRGTWRTYPEHDRLIAVENVVAHLLAEAQEYFHGSDAAGHEALDALRADLEEAMPHLPRALRAGLARLDASTAALLETKPAAAKLAQQLAFRTAGPRVESLTSAFRREIDEARARREIYRAYLVAYAAALLVLIGYLAARLFRSYALLNQANVALTAANEGLEARVAHRTRELSAALDQLKESEAQLIQSEKMSSLGQMVAGVAHEINTPLAYVKASLTSVKKHLPQLTLVTAEAEKLLAVLQSGAADPHELSHQFALVQALVGQVRKHQVLDELQALVGDGLHGIGEISELVVNLKNFSRLDRSRVATLNLNEAIESALLLAKHELKQVRVHKRFAAIPSITCSPSQINQVLLNIINNAAQAVSPGKGNITITTRAVEPDRVAVDIEDDGSGIPPDVLPKIFDPFFTTKKVGEGTGLGLSISYKIVKQHGGDISVHSETGVGTRFSVTLPLTVPEAPDATAEPDSLAMEPL